MGLQTDYNSAMDNCIDREKFINAASIVINEVIARAENIRQWENGQREWKSGTLFHRKNEKCELFCVAWDRGQMSFMLLVKDQDGFHSYDTTVTLFEMVNDRCSDDVNYISKKDTIDKVMECLPDSDYLYSRLMSIPNTKLPAVQRAINFGRYDSGKFNKYQGEVRVDNISTINGILEDLIIIPCYCLDTDE